MSLTSHICVDLASGQVQIGSLRVSLIPDAAPHSYLIDSFQGPCLRALGFEERNILVAQAVNGDIAQSITQAAMVRPGDASPVLTSALCLALAGGAEDSPPFSDCVAALERSDGWNWQRLRNEPALTVDRRARELTPIAADDGWNRLVFPEPTLDLEALLAAMVENLAKRSAQPFAAPVLEAPDTATARPAARKPLARIRAKAMAASDFKIEDTHLPSSSTPRPQAMRANEVRRPSPTFAPGHSTSTLRSSSKAIVTARIRGVDATISEQLPAEPYPVLVHSASPSTGFSTQAIGASHLSQPQTAPSVHLSAAMTSWPRPDWQPTPKSPPIAEVALTPPPTTVKTSPELAPAAFADWFDDLAAQLDAECDLRGLDP